MSQKIAWLLLLVTALAGETSASPLDVRMYLSERARQASVIDVLYTPVRRMGPLGFSREDAETKWAYSMASRCQNLCEERTRQLVAALSSVRDGAAECEGPISAVVAFRRGGETIDRIVIFAGGGCIELAGRQYVLKQTVEPVLRLSPLDW